MRTASGFTLIELLVATAIITILSLVVIPELKGGQSNFALQRSANKLAQDLRRVEEMAISVKEYSGAPLSFKGGYGMNFQISSPFSYNLFVDLNNNKVFDASDQNIENLSLEKGVQILSLSGAPLNIVFLPPDPQVFLSSGDPAEIILGLKDDPTRIKTIKVNKSGLISVE